MALPSHVLTSETVSVRRLDRRTTEDMWRVFHCYYEDVARPRFEEDLRPKSHVILLRDSGDRSLQGFSTLQTYERTVQGRRLAVLYSGDTIVGQAYWGQTALQKAWLAYAMRLKLRFPHLPTYWFLITKGYKTYLLMSRNFPEYWPRWDQATPSWQQAVLDHLATEKFGDTYDPEAGVIRHDEPLGKLREGIAPIQEETRRAHQDIRFFAEQNPGHLQGDELCCLGRIDLALCRAYLTKLGRRTLRRATRRWLPAR